MAGSFLFNLSPDRVNVPRQDWSGVDDLAGRYQQGVANKKAGDAAGQYAQGLTPEQIAQVAPMLKDPSLRAQGIKQIQEWRKPKEFNVQIAPDGTPLRIDEQAGSVEAIGARGQYARPREPSHADRNTPDARSATAERFGLKPGTEEHTRYVLTGSLPAADRGVTAGDREAIRDSDDYVASADATLSLLGKAKTLSGTAYEGPTAALRAKAMALTGDQAAIDTQNLDNILTENSLSSMKAIFGGNPTEGERAILLEIQGSSGKPKAVRDAIIDRAVAAVEARKRRHAARAEDLRGSTYYKPKGAPGGAQTGALPSGVTEDDITHTMQKHGLSREQVLERLK